MYRYGSVSRRNAKVRLGLKWGLTQDHHVIPLQFRTHAVVKEVGYDFNHPDNLIIMPTSSGMKYLNVRKERVVHENGHMEYNKYILKYLDSLEQIQDPGQRSLEFYNFKDFLRESCRLGTNYIPWK